MCYTGVCQYESQPEGECRLSPSERRRLCNYDKEDFKEECREREEGEGETTNASIEIPNVSEAALLRTKEKRRA